MAGFIQRLFGSSGKDDPAQRPATDDWWYGDAGGLRAVTPEKAMTFTAVYACVKVLAETLAQVPIKIYRDEGEDGKSAATDHPLWPVLRNRPAEGLTSFAWREMGQAKVALRGNAYDRILTDRRDRIIGFEPMHGHVEVKRAPSGRPVFSWDRPQDQGGGRVRLVQDEVLHVRGLTSNGLVGESPIAAMRTAIGLGLEAQRYGETFFKNDSTPRGVVSTETGFKDEEQAKQFHERWQKQARLRTMFLPNGAKYSQISMSMEDAQFLESRQFQVVDIARGFRVPPHMIGSLDKATFSNIEQQSLEFAIYTMLPWFRRWEAELNLLVGDGFFVEFLLDALLRGSTLQRYQAYQSAVLTGWMDRNEVRVRENLNPREGLSVMLEPTNMAPAGSRGEDEEGRDQ